jgi:hypothetical protein
MRPIPLTPANIERSTGSRGVIFTLEVRKHFPGVTCVAIDIVPNAEGCELTLTQTGVEREITEATWRAMLNQLAEVLCPTFYFLLSSVIQERAANSLHSPGTPFSWWTPRS